MADVTIEIDINAQGNVTVTPNPAFAQSGDRVTWHIRSNVKTGGKITLTLPGGPKSPFGNEADSVTEINKPAHCNTMGQADPINWPPGTTSYGYSVGFSGSPLLSLFRGTLAKGQPASSSRDAASVVESEFVFEGGQRPAHVINKYFFGAGPGGNVALTRQRVHLEHCVASRAWRNQSGAAQNRTVGAYPSSGDFPTGSTVTIFVAPDGHTGAPTAAMAPTTVGSGGDSVGKNVPNGSAVFVHYDQGTAKPTRVDADITEEP
ncbi:MAG TPA: hypothetical protein VN823_29170 [Stellaceae bacterium]|nr:hypothetical protein [Stellaceae bacterium]